MTDRPACKLGDTIILDKAVAIYAERDMRENDDIRGANSRSRDRITRAIERGELGPVSADGKKLLIEYFVSWAMRTDPKGPEHKPRGKGFKWVGKYADVPWPARFEGLYEAPSWVVRTFEGVEFETGYIYSDDDIRQAILHTPIPVPSGEAPEQWVEALGFARFQNDELRKRNAWLEARLGNLSKAGKSKGV